MLKFWYLIYSIIKHSKMYINIDNIYLSVDSQER